MNKIFISVLQQQIQSVNFCVDYMKGQYSHCVWGRKGTWWLVEERMGA